MYAVGHPEFIDQPSHVDISQDFGFVKCKILPLYKLYHPVLPHRQGHKLTFPLCLACVEKEQTKPMLGSSCTCSHTVEERALIGTWCSPELEKAVGKGYQVLDIYEMWHFTEKSDQLFKSYINTFLKIKQETPIGHADVTRMKNGKHTSLITGNTKAFVLIPTRSKTTLVFVKSPNWIRTISGANLDNKKTKPKSPHASNLLIFSPCFKMTDNSFIVLKLSMRT